MAIPIVAVVGRPNVGKSTLFNKIVGKKMSIVDDEAGVTRDGVFCFSEWNAKEFFLVDTAGFETKIKNNDFLNLINTKTKEYIKDANAIIFVVDCKVGLTNLDIEIANILKKTKKPIFLCANKCDSVGLVSEKFYEFYSIFQKNVFAVSAIHGHGLGDLLDCLVKKFKVSNALTENLNKIKIAVVGKPNAGKSSLVNVLTKTNRLLVSDVEGTTRDAIDVLVNYNEKEFTFIDTAGIRKKSKIKENVEKYSVLRAFVAIKRASVVVLVLDSTIGVVEQDLKIAGYVKKTGKALIVAVNKWDLIKKEDNSVVEYEKNLKKKLDFILYAPFIFLSAKTKKRVNELFNLIEKVDFYSKKRLTTGILNQLISYAVAKVQPPSKKGKKLKIFYMTQVNVMPPTFVVFVNSKILFNFSYERYLKNQIRKEFNFCGSPLKFIVKEKRE